MTSTGIVESAVKTLMCNRDRTWFDDITDCYQWKVYVALSDDISYEFIVTERIFSRFNELNVPYHVRVETITNFVYQLIEEQLMDEYSVPRNTLVS